MVSRMTAVAVAAVALCGTALGSPLGTDGREAETTPWTIKLKETRTREGGGSGTFQLLGGNAADTDSGKVTFAQGVGEHGKTADGLQFLTVPRTETLKGKRGSIVIRSSVQVFGVAVLDQDDSISTGTWTIVRATGSYAGLTGTGGLVGIVTAAKPGTTKCTGFFCYSHSYRYEGRVTRS